MYQTQSFDITFYRDLPNSIQLRFHTQKSLIYNFIILVNHFIRLYSNYEKKLLQKKSIEFIYQSCYNTSC